MILSVKLIIIAALTGKTPGNALSKLLPQIAISRQPGITGALGDRRIKHRPIFNIAIGHSRPFPREGLRLRRQGDDDVKETILQIVKGMGLMMGKIDPDLPRHFDGEAIGFTPTHTGGTNEDTLAQNIPGEPGSEWGAHGIHRAGKENCRGTSAKSHGGDSAANMKNAEQSKQSAGGAEIHFDPIGQTLAQ